VHPIQIVTMSSATIPFVEVTVFEALWPYKRQSRAEKREIEQKTGNKDSSKTQKKASATDEEGSKDQRKKTEAGKGDWTENGRSRNE